MNFEPQKLLIGLVGFFSVLMPGALLAFALRAWGIANYPGFAAYVPATENETTIVFLFASYLLGHLVFLLGALLDERLDKPLRGSSYWGQIERLADGKKLSRLWMRKLAKSRLLFGRNADEAVMLLERIKARALQSIDADNAINGFQWCKARLTKSLPEGLAAVQRFEADSKFFRSFFVVLGVLAIGSAIKCKWIDALLCLIGMVPTLWRYVDQRFKGIQQAYWLMIMLEAERMLEEKGPKLPPAAPRADGLTHAGGIVYRMANEKPEYMLIEASKKRSEWVLPKGHIEPGEAPPVTAVREVREETGHWARVKCRLADLPLDKKDPGSPLVRWFLLELCEGPDENERLEFRRYKWLEFDKAKSKASFDETRALLRYARVLLTYVKKRRRAATEVEAAAKVKA
jgi:8-oxo-dGTP pyrophosphatase MutT (NUDIX family)